MNGEDKILNFLQELSGKFDVLSADVGSLKEGQISLQKGQDELSGRVSSLQTGQDELQKRQIDIILHLENVTDKNMQLLLEQYTPNTNKLYHTAEEVDKIKFDVDNLKRVVVSHSKDINELLKR